MQFGPDIVAKLEMAYLGGDFSARRRFNFDVLSPRPTDRILDLGCGNGMLTSELARFVGRTGHVTGVDQSADMLNAAKARLGDNDAVTLLKGSAHQMPLDDASQDAVFSIQVFEYIEDIQAALREVHRVLKPGGRLAVGDMHFDCWTWASDDPGRMQRMMTAWDRHLVHRDASAVVAAALPETGFALERVAGLPMTDTDLRPDGMALLLMYLMRDFVQKQGLIDKAEADAWFDEQLQRAEEGRFFFSITHFVVLARKL